MGLVGKVLRVAGMLRDREDWTKPCIYACETHTEVAKVLFTWDEINVVMAYKIDLMTTDEIRVVVNFGRPEKVLELSEEQEGFEAFIRTAERKLSFPEGWSERLVKPAFETCETTLFRR
jgi:hypothetical protein